MDSDRKVYVAEALGGTLILFGSLVWAYNLDQRSTQPNEPTDNGIRYSDQGNIDPEEGNVQGYNGESDATEERAPHCDPTPPGYITNFETCADYRLVPHPTIPGKLCAEKGSYAQDNLRTLYGLRRGVGEGNKYIVEIIDKKTKEVIGYFPSGVDASFEAMYEPAMPDAIGCLVYDSNGVPLINEVQH